MSIDGYIDPVNGVHNPECSQVEQVVLEGMRLALWAASNAGCRDEGRDRQRSVTGGG